MNNIVDIKDLSLKYDNKVIFDKFNLEIKERTFTTIIGLNGSGKSTLVKIILGIIKAKGQIKIDNIILNESNIIDIRKLIGVVFENPDNQFVAETVMDDIAFSLENLKLKPSDVRKKIIEITDYLEIKELLNKEPHSLSGGEKQLVALASALVHEPKILILDEALTMIDVKNRIKIYQILKELNKRMTIISITHDAEELLYGDDIIIIDNGVVLIQGSKEQVLLEEKIFDKLHIELPFIVLLSIKLKYYALIDKLYFDMDELVNAIWK